MKLVKLIFTTLTLFILSLPVNANAYQTEIYYECNTCLTYSKFETVAEDLASQNGFNISIIYIFNPSINEMRKFRIEFWPEYEPGTPDVYHISSQSLTSSEQYAKNSIISARTAIQSMMGVYEVPPSVADSVYDLVGSSSTQNSVERSIQQQSSWNENVGHYFNAILSIAGQVVNINFVVDVNFSDGSRARFKITGFGAYGEVLFDFIQGEDSQGNNVPLEKAHFQSFAEFIFEGSTGEANLNEFIAAARRYGITISVSGSGSWSCGPSDSGVVCSPK